METGSWSGYLGTGDRKGRPQTSLPPVVTAPLLDSTAGFSEREVLMNVDRCDRTLVVRGQSGERQAFNALVCKYRPRVMKLAMRYMR